MKKILLFLLGISLFYGCSANTGVTRTEKGTFVVSLESQGISALGDLKAESIKEARVFCENSGRTLQVVRIKGSEPPYYLTNLPEIEIEFMCSDPQGRDAIVRAR